MSWFFSRRRSFEESGLLKGAVDNHCHILYGLDDGVKTLEESLDILAYVQGLGIKKVWFTPHVMEDTPNTTEGLKQRFEEFKLAYKGELEFSLAAEYMMDNLFAERLARGDLLLHGGDKVLVETSILAPPIDFWEILERMLRSGYRPLLAHPERYRYMHREDYDRLAKMGVLLQMNIPSLVGFYGGSSMEKAKYLLEKDRYCMLGTDCHRFHAIEQQFGARQLGKAELRHLEALMSGVRDV